ncbi:chalcone isomerase family protein [Thalassotalea piscium]
MYRLLLLSMLTIIPVSLFAEDIDKVDIEQSLIGVMSKDKFKPVGHATFSIMFWDLYHSQLLTTSGKYPIIAFDDKLIYEIHYLAKISNKDLIKRTIQEWQHLGINPNDYQNYIKQLADLWPDIEKDDKLTLLIDKGQSHFYHNGSYLGAINNIEFGQLFLDIWLSENTSEPSIRLDLLGGEVNE